MNLKSHSFKRLLSIKEKEVGWKSRQKKLNIVALLGLTGFTFWIYFYCIRVVKQDTFEDVDRHGNVSTKIKY